MPHLSRTPTSSALQKYSVALESPSYNTTPPATKTAATSTIGTQRRRVRVVIGPLARGLRSTSAALRSAPDPFGALMSTACRRRVRARRATGHGERGATRRRPSIRTRGSNTAGSTRRRSSCCSLGRPLGDCDVELMLRTGILQLEHALLVKEE